MKRIAVIGSGFAGLSAASFLAKEGHEVHVYEKNEQLGGRARSFEAEGFTFDMGPSWYWMPDVFDRYFESFGRSVDEFYDLVRLDPSYQVIFENTPPYKIPASLEELKDLFESLEPGSAKKLDYFLEQAKYKYDVGMKDLVYMPGLSLSELLDMRLIKGMLKMDVFKSLRSHVRKLFKHPHLRSILEFPVLFLGASPDKIPALYSLMNYADIVGGTWYPMGGMHKIVEGMVQVAKDLGVIFHTSATVDKIEVIDGSAKGIVVDNELILFDYVVAGADYHHVDQYLLDSDHRNYSKSYWDKRVLAPSSLIFYLGVDRRVPNLKHHSLFFDSDFEVHSNEIYLDPKWPSDPLFYVCAPSVTDSSVAPEGCENLFILMPVAPGLEDGEDMREKYFHMMMERLEKHTGVNLRDHLLFKRSYAHSEFMADYNSFKGNAYGLSNILMQTAHLKPSMKNSRVDNLYYTGQLTVPGPGVPPSLVSGELVSRELNKKIGISGSKNHKSPINLQTAKS